MNADEDRVPRVAHSFREYADNLRETIKVCRWVWAELLTPQSKKWMYRMFVLLGVALTLSVSQPRFMSMVFDGLIAKNSRNVLYGIVYFIAVALLAKYFDYRTGVAREWFAGINTGVVDNRITELFFEKSMGQHLHESSSLTVANVDKGRNRVTELEILLLFEGIPALFTLLLTFVFLFVLSPVAGCIMFLVLVGHLAWALYLNQRVIEVCVPIEKEFRALNRHRFERWDKTERVKVSGKESEELSHMSSWWDCAISEDRRFWVWYMLQNTLRGLVNFGGRIIIMLYGAWLVWTGQWTLGLLYPLFAWTMWVSETIQRLGNIERQINWNLPSVMSMIEALSIKPDVVDPPDAKVLAADHQLRIRFDHVSYTYPHGSSETGERPNIPTLRDISFTIEQGEKVALVGPSGAGKTTIMRLLLRFMHPTSGEIFVNGYNLRAVQGRSWAEQVGYVPQQSQIFDGSIRYNLLYGLTPERRKAIDDDSLWVLMRQLRIDFGERLTDGLETLVGRNGVKLSGGEAQRLMLGTAAIKNPRLMVIDEATSNLDSTTEKEVQRGLAAVLEGDVSALVVAHRLSTVRSLCSKFIVLRSVSDCTDGKPQIEAVAGSFEELYEISPTFRQLANDQGLSIHVAIS